MYSSARSVHTDTDEPELPLAKLPGSWEDLAVESCDCGAYECTSCRAIAKYMPRIVAEILATERARFAAEIRRLPVLHNHGVAVKPFPMSLDEYRAAVLAIIEVKS
jgi:hypothetical protein